jgi:hypothetical protein
LTGSLWRRLLRRTLFSAKYTARRLGLYMLNDVEFKGSLWYLACWRAALIDLVCGRGLRGGGATDGTLVDEAFELLRAGASRSARNLHKRFCANLHKRFCANLHKRFCANLHNNFCAPEFPEVLGTFARGFARTFTRGFARTFTIFFARQSSPKCSEPSQEVLREP